MSSTLSRKSSLLQEYLDLNSKGSSYADSNIGDDIRAAQFFSK